MKKVLLLGIAMVFLLSGCVYQEVVREKKCTKIVGTKEYNLRLLGFIPTRAFYIYYVLADGREILIGNVRYKHDDDNGVGQHCEMVLMEIPKLNFDNPPPR